MGAGQRGFTIVWMTDARYGAFDDDAREYVISSTRHPAAVDQLPRQRALLRADLQHGRAATRSIETRGCAGSPATGTTTFRSTATAATSTCDDRETGAWWRPTGDSSGYRCRHGLGYTVIESRQHGISVESLFLVPLGADLEMWRVRVTNERDTSASLSLFSAAEFCLWDAWDDATNFQRNLSTGEVEVDGSVIFHVTEYRERRDHFAYFACSEPLAGFDTQREGFLGPGRGWDHPAAVEEGESRNSIAHGWSPIGSHHVRLDLAPGEGREIIFVLGYWENPVDAKFDPPGGSTVNKRLVTPVIERSLQASAVDGALDELRERWSALLGRLQVSTPDAHVDRIANIWNPYQCMVTFNLSRSASMFESGIGRGMGFRDCCQDLLGFVHLIPERARERILDIAATQLPTGGAYHQYQPLTKRGNDAVGSGFNDDPLWLVVAVAAYLKETGDDEILDVRVPYDQQPGTETPLLRTSATVGPVHARPPRAARTAADRPGRLERLPQPELLLGDARRVVPDDREP